jgi:hypothetical protein
MASQNFIWPIGNEVPRLFTCPAQAAEIAAVSAPWDCRRGAVLVFDKSTLREFERSRFMNDGREFARPDMTISRHLVAAYWLDELVPGLGRSEANTSGPGRIRIVSNEAVWGSETDIMQCLERGVSEKNVRAVREALDLMCFSAIEEHSIEHLFIAMEPGAALHPCEHAVENFLDIENPE